MAANFCQLVPLGELAPGEVAAIRNRVINFLVSTASRELSLPAERLVVRDIRADLDLDYSYEDWQETTGATGDTLETMSTGTVADQRWIGIYGVKDDSEQHPCSQLKFNVGGSDRVIWQIQALNETDGMVGISPSAVILPQNAPYTISRYVNITAQETRLVLKGVVVEPRGKVVSP